MGRRNDKQDYVMGINEVLYFSDVEGRRLSNEDSNVQ